MSLSDLQSAAVVLAIDSLRARMRWYGVRAFKKMHKHPKYSAYKTAIDTLELLLSEVPPDPYDDCYGRENP